jgi:hypothetical protein
MGKLVRLLLAEDQYLEKLAENLMLDELVRGECDPVEFLKSTIAQTKLQIFISNKNEMTSQLENELNELLEGGE